MATGVMSSLFSGQLEAFSQAIEVGRADIENARTDQHKKAGLARTLDGFISHCLEIPRLLRRHCDSVLDLIATQAVDSYEETEAELRKSFSEGEQILQGVQDLAERFRAIGGSLNRVDALGQALEDAGKLKERFFAHWPRFTQQDADEALAAYQRGECLDADEAFAQIKGITQETWLQLVQERKQTRRT